MLAFISCKTNNSQEDPTVLQLKRNAVEIKDLTNLNSSIYYKIKNYELIMIGEQHGTKEPAEFAFGLAKLIAKKEGMVCLALEIPKSEINLKEINKATLGATTFFTKKNISGMNGIAWFNLILNCSNNENINLAFIDNYETLQLDRDSTMYMEIKKLKQNFPNKKIITLTGNLHNWLKPFSGKKMMGYQLKEDPIFNKNKIMSFNHFYNKGTMLNNSGNGLELKKIKAGDDFLSTTLPFDNYFCTMIFEDLTEYTHFLFTENVSYSGKIVNEN